MGNGPAAMEGMKMRKSLWLLSAGIFAISAPVAAQETTTEGSPATTAEGPTEAAAVEEPAADERAHASQAGTRSANLVAVRMRPATPAPPRTHDPTPMIHRSAAAPLALLAALLIPACAPAQRPAGGVLEGGVHFVAVGGAARVSLCPARAPGSAVRPPPAREVAHLHGGRPGDCE